MVYLGNHAHAILNPYCLIQVLGGVLMTEAKKKTETTPMPKLKLESWEDLFRAMCIVRGIDPNQIQSQAKFTNLDNNDERSYYATQFTAVAIAQLRMLGESMYMGDDWNEYELAADILSVGFMGYKGFKSEQ